MDVVESILLDLRRCREVMFDLFGRSEHTVLLALDERHAEEVLRCSIRLAMNLCYTGDGHMFAEIGNIADSLNVEHQHIYELVRDLAAEVSREFQKHFDVRMFDTGLYYETVFMNQQNVHLRLVTTQRG